MRNFTFQAILLVGAASASMAHAEVAADDTIVVTSSRATKDARAEQKLSPNLLNIQAAEDIIKYPDFNAAESLGRIPGVSIAIDTGEGRFVNIRGIDGNLNGTTFGSVVLLNTQPGGTYFGGGGRAVELDTIPIGAVDRLIVRKTGLPDQEAEGLGGSVELSPRSASNVKKTFLDFTIGGGYQPAHSNGQIIRLEAAAGTRFGGAEKPFGVVVYGSYHEDHRGFDDLEAGYFNGQADGVPDKVFDGVDFRRYSYNRRRFGFGGEVSYDPSADQHYFIRATNAGYTESVKRQILQLNDLGSPVTVDPANSNGFFAPEASSRVASRDEQETHLNFVVAAGGRNDLGGVTVDYQGSYTSATYHRDFDYNSRFGYQGALSVAYDNITNPEFPTFNTGSFDPNGTNLYTLNRLTNATERAHDREWAGQINATIPTTLLGGDGSFKVGAKLRLRDKIDVPANATYPLPSPAPTLAALQGDGPYNGFYGGRYPIGYRPDLAGIRALTNGGATNPNAGGFFNDTENIYAGYAQYQGKFGNLGVLAGVRVEHTQGTYRGNVITTPANGGDDIIVLTSRKNSYTNFFPTVQLRYDFTPALVARATWSTGIGRPGFLQLNTAATVDQGNLSVSVGNPNLKPTTVNAFDAALEYYLPESGIVSVGFFDKEFKDYVLSRVQRNVDYLGNGDRYTVNSYSNVDNSHARGIEAQYTQKFAMLPAPFDGLGFTGNITYVTSRIEIRPGDFSLLPGTSKLTWNVGGFYEAHGVQVRIAAQHVSAAIFGIGGSSATDVFQDARTTADLTTSYALTPQLSVYFNAKNLLNTPLRYYEGSKNRPIQREFYDISYEGGFRFTF
jgi:TonB-dependent receptor